MEGKHSPTKDQPNIKEVASASPRPSSQSHTKYPPQSDASTFLSPQGKSTSQKFNRFNSMGQQGTETDDLPEPSDTPLLNGENILLLSFSNDNTPVAANQSSPLKQSDTNDTFSNEQVCAESPPADSIHSGQLTTLSPPPLSIKSSDSAPPAVATQRTRIFGSNTSQGMYSQPQQPQTVSSHNLPSVGRKKRPPLPPKGAFLGMQQAAVDVLPSHLPPKQIGTLSHRRVFSTGDVSHISNLTEGDSVVDVEESPPNMMDAPAASATSGNDSSLFGVDRRQRGVSWDFGRANEEPAMFEGLGIMQPVLSEEDLNKLAMDDLDLLQPVLMEEKKVTKPSMVKKRAVTEGQVGKDTIGTSKLNMSRSEWGQIPPFAKKDESQFENEAEMAILAALNMQKVAAPSSDEEKFKESPHTPPKPNDAIGTKNLEIIERSPKPPNIHNLNQRGDLLFEDQGWHDGYDALGRAKGSLREEQDVKIIEDVFDEKLTMPVLGKEKSLQEEAQRPPTYPGPKSSSVGGFLKPLAKTAASKKKKDDDHDDSDDEDNQIESKHMRSKTAVSEMAQEMAKYQSAAGVHNRNKNLTKDSHGIDNLLDGVDLLYKTNEKKTHTPKKEAIEAPNHDDDNDENYEGDEEMGQVKHARKRAKFISATRRSPSSKSDSRSEKMYQLKRWYVDLIKPKMPHFLQRLKHGILFIYVPLLSLAFILYYLCRNPIAAKFGGAGVTIDSASWSWWLLFLVRQTFILGCVKTGEVITIDIIALRTPLFVNVFGSFATLMLVQARGWPYVWTFWGLMDFIFLYGSHRFAAHWLFWQSYFDIFTSTNPAGTFIYSLFYTRILITMIVTGVLTALKRLWIATYLGRRSYLHFGPELEIILGKMLLVSSVAHLARQIESQIVTNKISDGYVFASISKTATEFHDMATDSEAENSPRMKRKSYQSNDEASNDSHPSGFGFGKSLIESGVVQQRDGFEKVKKFTPSKRLEIMNLLEEWEEPNMQFDSASKTKIKDILQFRQAISLMNDDYCFTSAFGPTSTRAICVDSSEALFNRLVGNDPNATSLPFETLAEIAYDSKRGFVKPKIKALIKLFRPDRNGYMAKIDFLNSIDSVYKSIRLFRASLESSSQVDDNLEGILNVVFYALLFFLSLFIMGFRVWESLLSVSTFLFGFSFMFGPASSNYFEGLLFILLRRPYDVGDKIALSSPSDDTSPSGSSTWFVEEITLFATTVRFATTNEVATYSNGSLAQLRIINTKRSPKAILYVYVKFGSDAPFNKLNIFRSAIEGFVKARPREWAQLNGIRTTRVEMELNYVEYVIVVTHREMWQNIGPILSSQADLASFSLEVSKKLGLRYHQPSKPVHLSLDADAKKVEDNVQKPNVDQDELDSIANLFKKDE